MNAVRDDSDKVTFMVSVNQYISDYIKFADVKATGILSIVVLIGAAISVSAKTILATARDIHIVLFVFGVFACGGVALSVFITLWRCVDAFVPRTNLTERSLASFPDIAKVDVAIYLSEVVSLTPEQIVKHYANHNVTLSKIAKEKFEAITSALYWMRISLISSYLAALVYAVTVTLG